MIAPKLRFSEFKDEWIEKKIGNLINIKSGLGFKADEYVTEKEIPLLQIENVGYGSIKWGNNVKYVPTEYLKKHENLALKINDIVLALNRPVTNDQLKISKLTSKDIPSILYQRVGKIETKDLNIDSSFIFQYFQIYLKDYIVKSSLGSDQPFISILDLYAQKIEIPQIQEQTKIAEFLSAVDDKISQLTRQLELLNQYKKGVMQKIFSQEIRFKNDNGEDFGEWDFGELKKFCVVNPKTEEIPDNFYYVDLESVDSGRLLHMKKVLKKNSPSRASRVLAKKDILFQTVRPYQQNNFYFNLEGDFVASTGYAQIKTEKNNPKFIYYLLHTKSFLDEVLNRCTGTSYPAINGTDLSTIEVQMPTIQEQKKIAEFLTAIDERIDHTTAQLTYTKQWKKGLLQQMFV